MRMRIYWDRRIYIVGDFEDKTFLWQRTFIDSIAVVGMDCIGSIP